MEESRGQCSESPEGTAWPRLGGRLEQHSSLNSTHVGYPSGVGVGGKDFRFKFMYSYIV